ncbi:MAG: oligosaccharide flippase family protein [Rhodospirillaceae bacterium]|nr:oligosaccharide flippase family protein [Rhodospirillaceae bacterium]
MVDAGIGKPDGRPDGASGRFDVDHLRDQLGRRVISGGMISIGAQVLRIALNLLSIAILARLIPPAEFGVVALALPIAYLASDIAQYALGQVTVQRQYITQAQVSALFWANLLIAGAVTALLAVASGAVAAFYDDHRVAPVLMALALSTLLSGAASQFSAILSREMRFWALQGSAILAEICGIAGAVWAAYAGLSYWAIVIQILVRQAALLVLRIWWSRWLPDGPATLPQARGLVSTGGNLAVFSLLTQLGHGLGVVVVGRVLGDVQAGLFLRAWNIANWPVTQVMGPLGSVLTPALARVAGVPGRLDAVHDRVLVQTAMVAVPLGATFVALAEPITLILLGEQWREATILLAALGVRAFTVPLTSVIQWRLIASGGTAVLRRFALLAMPVTLAAYGVATQFGLAQTAAAQGALSLAVFLPLLIWLAGAKGGPPPRRTLAMLLPFVLAMAAITIAASAAYRLLPTGPGGPGMAAAFALGLAVICCLHLGFCLAVPRYRRELFDVAGRILAIAPRRNGKDAAAS